MILFIAIAELFPVFSRLY